METAVSAPASSALQEHMECDVAVVGAGLCGLNAAIELATQGTRVCVLDAATIAGSLQAHTIDRAVA